MIRRGRKQGYERQDHALADAEEWEAETRSGWTVRSAGGIAASVSLVRWGAWALLAASPLLAGYSILSSPSAAEVLSAANALSPAQPREAATGQEAGPTGFAELYVAQYLAADADTSEQLAAFYPAAGELGMAAWPEAGHGTRPELVAAVATRKVVADTWSVTVAAQLAAPDDGQDEDAGEPAVAPVRYFRVPVRIQDNGALAATALPAEVAAPEVAEVPGLDYGDTHDVADSDPVAQTLTAFFSGYLTGAEGIDRYLAPGTRLATVAAPYDSVRLTGVAEVGSDDPFAARDRPADGERRQLLAHLEAVDGTTVRPMTYALTLAARDGRWEVAGVDLAPVLEGQQPAGKTPARPEGAQR